MPQTRSTCALPLENPPPRSCLTEPTDLVQLPATHICIRPASSSMHIPLKLVLRLPKHFASFYGHHAYSKVVSDLQKARLEGHRDGPTHTRRQENRHISLEYCTSPRQVPGTWEVRSTPDHDIWRFSRHVQLKLSCHGLQEDLLLLSPLQNANVGL